MNRLRALKYQTGAATLVTAVILLIGITLITILTSKTVLQETKMAANNYRAAQASSAADAAMDYAIAYFDAGGFDHNNDDSIDVIPDLSMSLDGTRNLQAEIVFNNDFNDVDAEAAALTVTTADDLDAFGDGTRYIVHSCFDAKDSMKSGMIIVRGFSDDGEAMRVITQCVGTIDVFGGNGPKQALISRGQVGLTGNYQIINRFNNTGTWAGGDVAIGSSASASTYIRPAGTRRSDFTQAQLEDTDTTNTHTSEEISDRNKGNGVDTIASDPRLANLTGDEFFNNFFFTDKAGMKDKAIGYETYFTAANIGSADGESGIVWIEGDATLNGGTIGTSDNPVIFVINGNLRATGNPTVYGMLYVVGQLDAAGTVHVFGSVLVEGDVAMVPAGEDPVVGHGGVDLVYTPFTLDEAKNPLKGLTTVVSGTWRDW